MSFLGVMDPTWPCETGGGRVKRGADRHYTLAKNVRQLADEYRASEPWVARRCDTPGLLWLWATSTAMVRGDAHGLAALLGFRPCCGFVWCKVDDASDCCEDCVHGACGEHRPPRFSAPRKLGLGQWSRVEHEHLLLCRRGKVLVPPTGARQRSVIYAARGEHSEKPEAAWRVIESVSGAVLPGVIGCEWNARRRRPGWSAFGRLRGEAAPLMYEREELRDG